MSNTVTLQEVRNELARFATVMMVPGDPRINPSINTLVIEVDEDTKEDLPKLSAFLERARQTANDYSSLDAHIPEVDVVIITNDSAKDITGFGPGIDGKRALIIRTDLLLVLSEDMALSMLAHEYKHHHHINNQKNMTDYQHQLIELNGDRAAENSLALCLTLLVLMTSDEYSDHYYPNGDNKHPPLRSRIHAALEESYGNGVFRDSGEFNADFQFQPKRQDFMPVLENGKKITNWDSELAPAFQQLVDEDMRYLDSLVGVHGKPIEAEAVREFINYVRPRIEAFYANYRLDAELPSNDYLAKQFEKALEVPVRREGVMNMHEKMPMAFKAYDEAVQNANHFITPFAQDVIINNARRSIVDGIREGNYPDITQAKSLPEQVDVMTLNVSEIVY